MSSQIIAHTPLAADDNHEFIFKRLTGRESLSNLYLFSAEFLSRNNQLELDLLLGKDISLAIPLADGGCRYLHGYITGVELNGAESTADKHQLYTVTLQPALWYLTQNRDNRIWQEKTIPDIITSVLSEFNLAFENLLTSRYRAMPFCVQYQESTFDFLSRLMEHEGIYYYFKHHKQGHTLVLADSPQAHGAYPGYEEIDYRRSGFGLAEHHEGIQRWSVSQRITPDSCRVDDYDFRQPRADLAQESQRRAVSAAGKTELFDWPGRYDHRQQGRFLAKIRQQASDAERHSVAGLASARGLAPGYIFHLRHGLRSQDEQAYLVTAVDYALCDPRYHRDDRPADNRHHGEFSICFTVIPASITWRPSRRTPWPKTHGPQTAEVAGPPGKAIWTDKYGRVKVKFRWDRRGAGDDTGSCWVRVSSHWAGWKYGSMQVPRVGEEVIVDFLNGDPDRPIITGRVYNEDAMPPWELPASATKMGFMSRSKAGGVGNASFWFMEDAPGRESFALHAERDMTVSVERDKSLAVNGNLTWQINGQSQFTHLGSCITHKLQPDLQTFQWGKTALIGAGGRADAIVGGEYKQVTGTSQAVVSENLCRHAGQTISHHALDSLMFDAGNRIIFGDSLYLSGALPSGDSPAQASLATVHGATTQEIAARRQVRQQQNQRRPTHMVFSHGVRRDINGVDKQLIAGHQEIEAQQDVTRSITGSWRERVGQDLSLHSDGNTTLNCGGDALIESKSLVHKIEGHMETHAGNALYVAGSTQSMVGMSFSMSNMAVATNEMLTTTTRMHLSNTDIRMETVGINIGKGQLDIRSTLLSLNTSAITIFI